VEEEFKQYRLFSDGIIQRQKRDIIQAREETVQLKGQIIDLQARLDMKEKQKEDLKTEI
jgi:predicted ester cyclase